MAKLRRVCSLRGHDERVWHVAWRPNSKRPMLASSGADLVVRIWGTCGPKASAVGEEDAWGLLAELDASDRHTRTLRSVTWSPDGAVLAVASFDATTSLWREVPGPPEANLVRFECISVLSGHENEVKSAAFSPSGSLFATCSRDRSAWVYDAEDTDEYECVALLQSHTQDVKCVKWHPHQDVLFSCSYDDTVKVWGPDGDDWCCKETLEGHESTVWSMSFDSAGSRFVTCSDDKTLRVWAPKSEIVEAPRPSESSNGYPAFGGASVASALYLSPLFRGAASIAASRPEETTEAAQESPSTNSDSACRTAPSDAASGWGCACVIKGEHPRPVYAVDWLRFAAGGTADCIVSACGDNRVRVFQPKDAASLSSWACVANVEAHDGDVNCVAWCPVPLEPGGAAFLASAGDDAEIGIWEFSS
eukprot:gb/GFBE01043060.1/.p1 GENE.gb/GFBE01043060.1/~~gb/GFBE01043060.1/.p1  ORF type:complete len:419 (+),score=67.36 gb/GFBE01043060.1/:1-1257(+)